VPALATYLVHSSINMPISSMAFVVGRESSDRLQN
jgi:hypothetical protein